MPAEASAFCTSRRSRRCPDLYSVEAICDIDADKAAAVAGEHGIPRAVTEFGALLDLDLDVIDIATPSAVHFTQATEALRAGRHVIVEKPIGRSLAEVDLLKTTEIKSGKRLSPVYQYRFGNGLQRFLHLKAKGLVGRPYVGTSETHWRRTASYYDNPWRGRRASELGGCLVTHAIHAHDIVTEVLGPIASVYARARTRVNPIETEDCAALLLDMQSGALVTLSVTLGSEEEMSRLRFCFDGLTVESGLTPYNPGSEPWRFVAEDEATQARVTEAVADFVPGPERWEGQFARLHAALTEGAPLPVTIDDARRSLELLTAAYYSVETGEAVNLPIGVDHSFYNGWLPGDGKAASRGG